MKTLAQCGTGSFRNAALTVAIIDIILSSIILILFVLGSSLMVAFEYGGHTENVTQVLDEITDDVFNTKVAKYTTRQRKDAAEDMAVFLLIMALSTIDFAISCIFLDGVKSRNILKCQAWFNIRIVTIIMFQIVFVINLIYGHSLYRCIPDVVLTIYRITGFGLGYCFLNEIRDEGNVCKSCGKSKTSTGELQQPTSTILNLSHKRKEVKRDIRELPTVTITGPDEARGVATSESSPSIAISRKNSPAFMLSQQSELPHEFKMGRGSASSI